MKTAAPVDLNQRFHEQQVRSKPTASLAPSAFAAIDLIRESQMVVVDFQCNVAYETLTSRT